MSQVRLVVRDANRDMYGTPHGSDADRVIAALNAEPETFEDLQRALDRFCKSGELGFFAGFRAGINDEPYDAGLVVVDLPARLVVCESTYSSPGRTGDVAYHDGERATGLWLRYQLSDDWKFVHHADHWQSLADKRRRERAAQPPLDARATLYGKPMLEFIARAAFAAFSLRESAPASDDHRASPERHPDADWHHPDEQGYAEIRDIHACWLMTPREDLRGHSPRDVILAKRSFIDRDMQHRCEQWSRQGRCPPTLDVHSHAYQYAGFGTHEWVEYYELLRALLWSCREQVLATASAQALSVGDFLTTEVPRLEQVRDGWLDSPDAESSNPTTRRAIIEHERMRLPEAATGHDALVDHDCPMCETMAELPGPMFWHLDGCNMDDDFAFSSHRTRAEWEEEQRRWAEFSRRFDEREAERKSLGVEYPSMADDGSGKLWQRSYLSDDSIGLPLEARLFDIGSHLAAVIVDLKQPLEGRPLIDRLKRDFGNLREVVRSTDVALTEALVEPVVDRFCETLEAVADAREDLDEQCADLQQRLRRFLDPPQEPEMPSEFGEDDIPF
ncbi:MAG TPA: hypothetical protein VFW87_20485 [Pirellulales bacterium]|nr:hypothetical protein [Pirellulales bacterium]